jgi:hypothetical protein
LWHKRLAEIIDIVKTSTIRSIIIIIIIIIIASVSERWPLTSKSPSVTIP